MKKLFWHVVYYVNGKRHVSEAFATRDDASDALQNYRADGYGNAQLELLIKEN